MPAATSIGGGTGFRRYGLWLNGLDVSAEPGTPGNRPGVDMASVVVFEAGTDQVSTLDFDIIDPAASWVLAPGWVRLWDLQANEPLFTGSVAQYSISPEGIGRRVHVQARGLETLLDDQLTVVAAPSPFPGFSAPFVIAWVCNTLAQARLPAVVSETVDAGNATAPVGRMETGGGSTVPLAREIAVGARTSIRSFLRTQFDSISRKLVAGGPWVPVEILIVVDAAGRLRAWDSGNNQPADWSTLTVSDTFGSTYIAAGLSYEVPTDQRREVDVTGFLTIGDGSGQVGGMASVSVYQDIQPTVDSFFGGEPGPSGSFYLLNLSAAPSGVHAGGLVSITDAQAGLSGTFRIASITKTFSGSRQTWRVAFGDQIRSGIAQIKRVV